MSKHETPMTKGFWQSVAHGAFIPEYPLARRTSDCGARRADAMILPDEPHRCASFDDYPSLKGRNVIVVQTKAKRMGMYLMGQAVFSAQLARARGATSVRSILLCYKPDAELLPLLAPFADVEVWLSDPANPLACRRMT